jgi:uncharacterized membrane protein YcgQ (UPF0703/DUF1980 family)
MRNKASDFINGVTLVGIGAILLAFFFSGRLDQYLHPTFRPWTLAAGVVFCLGGVIYALAKTTSACCIEGECIHPNAGNPWRSVLAFCVLFVPLAAGAAFSKDSFDRSAVLNRGFVQDVTRLPGGPSIAKVAPAQPTVPPEALGNDIDESASQPLPQDDSTTATNSTTAAKDSSQPSNAADPNVPNPAADQSSAQYLPKSADGNVALDVTDLLYGETEESLRKMFVGKTVEVTGQYLPGSDAKKFKLVRMFIVCCAADARPLAVPVEVSGPLNVADMGWVKVTGTPVYSQSGERTKVVLNAAKVESTDPPEDAMLY